MDDNDSVLRARAVEAFDKIPSLDTHGELTRLILAEITLLTNKYRNVRRHDVPHIQELAGLLDVLWQEVEMVAARGPALAMFAVQSDASVRPAILAGETKPDPIRIRPAEQRA
ncbi:hypothetical protein [Sphingosinicella sp. BN140058]|uniref:hypothetical protein n=1 Tax=Sphingosinicella sp. BN140058 TaxID=1892855 RepID=UPI001011997C|nr:hypothetical protein [Sphingosinicella sp. BN140058]QAY75092.1 hypothetical protein ETR14_00015 [Sphingosinicella sp. BN140058]